MLLLFQPSFRRPHCFLVVIAGKSGDPPHHNHQTPLLRILLLLFWPLFIPRALFHDLFSLQVHLLPRLPKMFALAQGERIPLRIGHHQKNGYAHCCSVTARHPAAVLAKGRFPSTLIPLLPPSFRLHVIYPVGGWAAVW